MTTFTTTFSKPAENIQNLSSFLLIRRYNKIIMWVKFPSLNYGPHMPTGSRIMNPNLA